MDVSIFVLVNGSNQYPTAVVFVCVIIQPFFSISEIP